ncbi:hypothetical protein BDQ12DRAFT_611474 [Crucibulum laeve]|uniref:DUF6533 domain-containing protein n=1 Tax=Crucibulum laeve TaxID=68775 RepID=A0A5C3LT62_9AGAR|nr:hypothetical protein BDQ12DRAFT_611474 [Crucibulum laeve]
MSNLDEEAKFRKLFISNLVPLYVVIPSLTWILHDYFATLEDEIRYIWSQQRCPSKFMYFWIRYYSIALLIFDVTQIHLFSRPGITSDVVCVAFDPITRIAGAISLWSVEIIMQLRVYALFKCSKKACNIAYFNGFLFLLSIAAFFWVLVHNVMRRSALIADAIHLPLPGCPTINAGIQWAQWVPATIYEGILFSFALVKSLKSATHQAKTMRRISLYSLLIHDNILYFFVIACLLVFNNLMVVGMTHIPWFSFGPFHAAIGILTTRMLINLRKYTEYTIRGGLNTSDIDMMQYPHGDQSTTMANPENRVDTYELSQITAVGSQRHFRAHDVEYHARSLPGEKEKR